jgi:hypothetical protein
MGLLFLVSMSPVYPSAREVWESGFTYCDGL